MAVDRFVTRDGFSGSLDGRNIALWQSHGWYFEQKLDRWEWQRARIFQTVEDLYPQSYVLPFLIPMLENAGAYVMTPRERDTSRYEVIVDRDGGYAYDGYSEHHGKRRWSDAPAAGFGYTKATLEDGDNMFRNGGVRMVKAVEKPSDVSTASWHAEIPADGTYAVYVSYATLPESAPDVTYRINSQAGTRRVTVNQRMGGGTWVYLGHFPLKAGRGDKPVVEMDNISAAHGAVVTADAVKIGGGMGNVARRVASGDPAVDYEYHTSGYPRFTEGARYWLQWAGFDESVYAPKNGGDDYKEDYMSRAHWVNALMGGSERLPGQPGLNIPVDLALAFHTDAGARETDEIVGTLGICCTRDNEGLFEGGASRYRSRDLTDLVMTQIVQDIRATWEPEWQRRGLWNRSYYEARVPSAPTMLLELLSHQNFADMRYGHDPRFKFLVARAVYKGILQHIAAQYDYSYMVQPLPVADFSVELDGAGTARLRWRPVEDRLEITAHPTGYIVYTAIDNGDFDNGTRVREPEWSCEQEPGRLYRYRVSACNEGGESFPCETLAACSVPDAKGTVLIVNGFTRISAIPSYSTETEAGFPDCDGGVPDRCDISYIGRQRNFNRAYYADEHQETALGGCDTDCESEIVAGNTFDYPALHGRSVVRSGYSFCSTSLGALLDGSCDPERYAVMDLILGKQRSTLMGRGVQGYEFEAFPVRLQQVLRDYTAAGGSLLVSGSHVASDLWESENSCDADRRFAREVLHYEYAAGQAARTGKVRSVSAQLPFGECRFRQEPGPEGYAAGAPDALNAVGTGAFPAVRYAENDRTAGIAFDGEGYRTVVLGFPFETIPSEAERDRMMNRTLRFLTQTR